MKLVDANVLLHAANEAVPEHAAARAWLDAALSGTETIALPWAVLLAFLRVSTLRAAFAHPYTPAQALDEIARMLAQPCVQVVGPTERHFAVLRDLLLPLGTGGNITTDAHLAAIAVEHGAEVVSFDRDFARFPGVRWVNPLAPRPA